MGRDSRRLRLVLALLLLTAFTFLTLDARRGHGAFGTLRGWTGDVFGPVERGVRGTLAPVGDAFSAAFHAHRDTKRIRALEQQNMQLRDQVQRDGQASSDVAQLTRLGYVKFRGSYDIKGATVVGVGPSVDDLTQTVTISGGRNQGYQQGDAVITPDDGLVGRIERVDSSTSVVGEITDPSEIFTVNLEQPRNVIITVTGRGQGQLLGLTVVTGVQTATIPKGARLVTSQASLVRAKGLGVGTVVSLDAPAGGLTQTGLVQPFASLSNLDVVGVVTGQAAGGPDTSLPPLPAVSPPPSPAPSIAPVTQPVLPAPPSAGVPASESGRASGKASGTPQPGGSGSPSSPRSGP
jgi:rod shape-determining protein MreC